VHKAIVNILSGRFSFVLCGVMVLVTIGLFFTKVDLEPKITPDFFFSSDSEIYKQDRAIQREFPFQQQLLLNISTNQITDPNYIEKVRIVTERVKSVRGITDVQRITSGPDDIEAAMENPLWSRLLIGENGTSTFLIAYVQTDEFEPLVRQIEKIVSEEQNQWFSIRISGLPYIVEQIRQNLKKDMVSFTTGAVILSALMLLIVFRSLLVVTGALIACITAAMATLVIQAFMGIPIGVLTANLGTIVFVLTLSHIIFIVANWCNAAKHNPDEAKLNETIRHTLPASFWAALTTLLGFASLIFVEAKPLNQLGTGGAVGTAAALFCAYTVFPAFLHMANVNPGNFTYALAKKFPLRRKVALALSILVITLAAGAGGFGVPMLNTDPSLLSYFKKDTDLYQGLYHIDENGGSNPLLLVVRQNNGEVLASTPAYNKMWNLQQGLNQHESVGSVISLPLIMAEGDEHWLGQLLPWNMLLDILSKPEYGGVAKSFMSEDRTKALFMLRMKENSRERDRLSIIEEIEQIPVQYGFDLVTTGGTYYLQGELASSVAQSMTTGVLTLVVLFGVIALIVSGSIILALSVLVCALCVAGIVLGLLGLFGIPVDIISSPSINICLGLIVDDMIHLSVTAKRHMKEQGEKYLGWSSMREALNTQSWPAIISTLTIMIGFSVFGLSDFPPSQRFGLEIVFGAFLAVVLALGVFPYLSTRRIRAAKD
jgi:predicted RND superfamily exporter protein